VVVVVVEVEAGAGAGAREKARAAKSREGVDRLRRTEGRPRDESRGSRSCVRVAVRMVQKEE
jgi:hypothetical protein